MTPSSTSSLSSPCPVTPHAAAITDPASGARRVAENIARFWAGEAIMGLVSRETGC